jgi:hypothetical protein
MNLVYLLYIVYGLDLILMMVFSACNDGETEACQTLSYQSFTTTLRLADKCVKHYDLHIILLSIRTCR